MSKLLVGSWDGGRRDYPSNVTLDVRYNYNPDGTFNWIGEGPFFTVITSGDWVVKDGRVSLQINTSNYPAMAAPGSRFASKIEELTETRFSYVDQITGQYVTDRRVR